MLSVPKLNLFNIGISGAGTPAEANRIRLINMVGVIPLSFYFFCTLFCLYGHYYRIVYINIGVLTAISIALFLNSRYQYSIAKAIIICTHCVSVLSYYKLMMNEPSMFFYYFPITLTCILFYNPEKERKILTFTLFFLALSILFTLFLPYSVFKPFPLPATLHAVVFVINAVICIGLTSYYVYNMFRINIKNEKILTNAKRAAEEAATAKTSFLSNMSHELRTPLNGIIGITHILKTEPYLPGQEYYLSSMGNLSEHMLGLVNNVLDFSKIDAGKLELNAYRFNINSFIYKVDTTFRRLFEDKGICCKIDVDARLNGFDVFADELRLQQVMNNLLSNALKFTEKGGTVTISVATVKKESENIKLFFAVTDDGIGIASHHLNTIFESFSQGDSATTRKYGGSGLGLAISESLIKKFDGTIGVNSDKGKGSTFYFMVSLPVFMQEESKTAEEKTISIDSLKNFRVLMAEDNKVNMIVASKAMQKWGIHVTEAENGEIAYNKFVKEDFDLVLLDLEMPVMDGIVAVKKINKLNKGVPVIAFTAGVYENMKENLLAAGFNDYLLKPFLPEDLYRKILNAKTKSIRA